MIVSFWRCAQVQIHRGVCAEPARIDGSIDGVPAVTPMWLALKESNGCDMDEPSAASGAVESAVYGTHVLAVNACSAPANWVSLGRIDVGCRRMW